MSRTTTMTAAATLALTLGFAAPATAAAPTVTERLAKADVALAKASKLAARGSDAVAAAQLARADRLTLAADRRANGARGRTRAAQERAVAVQYQQNAEVAARLVRVLDGSADARAAKEVADAVARRQNALDVLGRLVVRLPAAAQPGIARAIAAVTEAGPKPAASLEAAQRSGDVDATATDEVETAITEVGDGVRADAARLDALAAKLPAAARRGIERARTRAGAASERASTRRGAAQACRSEREADPAAFEAKYRTNGAEDEESNAYGMCVSGHSAANRPGRPESTPAGGPGAAGGRSTGTEAGAGAAAAPAGTPAGPPAGVPAGPFAG